MLVREGCLFKRGIFLILKILGVGVYGRRLLEKHDLFTFYCYKISVNSSSLSSLLLTIPFHSNLTSLSVIQIFIINGEGRFDWALFRGVNGIYGNQQKLEIRQALLYEYSRSIANPDVKFCNQGK